jgi:hypothetical protein
VYAKVHKALESKGLKRLPKDLNGLIKRSIKEINSATGNLVPDRADTNKAIEVVRGNTRKCIKALSTGQWPPRTVPGGLTEDKVDLAKRRKEEFGTDSLESNTDRMHAYKDMAEEIFVMGASGGDITVERNRMHGEILGHIEGCTAPAELWTLLHDIVHSVTFDFSPNIRKANTEKAINWQKKMRLNEEAKADKQLDDLLSLLDKV